MNSIANADIGMISSQAWANEKWQTRRNATQHQLKQFIPLLLSSPPGCDVKLSEWALLNRLRSGYGRFAGFMFKLA